MKLEFRRFQEKNFQEVASWFVDPELDRRLGPMDWEWLEAALSEKELEGTTWAVVYGEAFVAVAQTAFDPEAKLAAISALAVKPYLRGRGVGTVVLKQLLAMYRKKGCASACYLRQGGQPSGAALSGSVPC